MPATRGGMRKIATDYGYLAYLERADALESKYKKRQDRLGTLSSACISEALR